MKHYVGKSKFYYTDFPIKDEAISDYIVVEFHKKMPTGHLTVCKDLGTARDLASDKQFTSYYSGMFYEVFSWEDFKSKVNSKTLFAF